MSQVSKWRLATQVEERILQVFWRSWGKGVEWGLENSIGELLTETERTVLAKRLAIAMMLVKGFGYSEIREFLHVSPPTIAKVKDWLTLKPGFGKVVRRLSSESEMELLWEKVKGFLLSGGPDLLPGTNWSVRIKRKSGERRKREKRQEAITKI